MSGSAIGFFLPCVVDSITKRCEEFVENNIKLVRGAEREFDRLRKNLRDMRRVIEHAVGIQSKNEAVRGWLSDLKEVMYDAEDLLDQIDVDISLGKEKSDGGMLFAPIRIVTSAVGKYMRGNPKAEQIKEINDKIDGIIKRGQQWGLWNIAKNTQEDISSLLKNRETSSILDVDFPLIGRDDVTSKIINLLVQGASNSNTSDADYHKLSVLPIVGMGGIGKTTLTRHVFNDKEKVELHFKLKIWVSVGMYQKLDVKPITTTILKSIRNSTKIIEHHNSSSRTETHYQDPVHHSDWNTREDYDSMSLDLLQTTLIEKVQGKHPFLLVLDDVWDAPCAIWDELLKPLKAYGKDSWIIVTTRNDNVANTISRTCGTKPVHLEGLDKEIMWTIFKMHAFRGKDVNDYPHLERIGRGIVKRLNGLPLAAQTSGSILNGNTDRRIWEKLFESELLGGGNIHDILLLSYYSLPANLKQCFSYLSLFPKDWKFSRWYKDFTFTEKHEREIVSAIDISQQWMAHKLLQIGKKTRIHDLLHIDGFGEFLCRSLLHKQYSSYIVMHDLIHDLTEMISEEECYRESNDTKTKLTDKVRHVSFIEEKSNSTTLWELKKYKRLRTLLFHDYDKEIDRDLLDKWFQSFSCLRVLYLQNVNVKYLPDSIGNLKLLRHLSLQLPNLKELPESTYLLYNLQTLNLCSCWGLSAIAEHVRKLVNLRFLNVQGNILENISGIGALTNLQELDTFCVRDQDGYRISELKNMNRLSGSLLIKNLDNIQDKMAAQEAQLHLKDELEYVTFSWRSSRLESEQNDLHVLEGLCPSNNLKQLRIEKYGGSWLPDWLRNQCLISLGTIELCDCIRLKSFQSMATLQNLQFFNCPELSEIPFLPSTLIELRISNCAKLSGILSVPSNLRCLELKGVGLSSIQVEGTETYPELHNQELSLFPFTSSSQSVSSSTSCLRFLHTLIIEGCDKLDDCVRTLLRGSSSSMKHLSIDGYDHPLDDLSYLTTLTNLKLARCSKKVIIDPTALSALEVLRISRCQDAVITSHPLESYSSINEHAPFPSFLQLRIVTIEGVKTELLRSVLLQVARSPLKFLDISSCEELLRINDDLELHFLELTTLESLSIGKCNTEQLMGLLPAVTRSPLKTLNISDWDESICINKDLAAHFFKFTTLESLFINKCNMEHVMGLLSAVTRSPLKRLYISDLVESVFINEDLESHFSRFTTLEYLSIEQCNTEQLTRLFLGFTKSTLKELTIYECDDLIGLDGDLESHFLQLTNLESLYIDQCHSLPTDLRGFSNLRWLTISNCSNLSQIADERLPNSLKVIDINGSRRWR